MDTRLKRGEKPRSDTFFSARPPFCSPAEEVIESVLLKAEREPEEHKLPYQAKLIADILFDPEIDLETAHQLLRFAEALSYRQYSILALARDTSSFDLYDGPAQNIGPDKLSNAQTSFLSDCWDLELKGLLWTGSSFDLNLYEIYPRRLNLQPLGKALLKALALETIPSVDIDPLGNLFSYGSANVPPKEYP